MFIPHSLIFVYMNVLRDLNNLPLFKNAVITIGTFDGVHKGHKKILAQLQQEAKMVQGETVVITFDPHPRKIVGDTSGVQLITTLDEKIELLEAENIDNLVIVPFNEAFANLSADEYVQDFLYQKFKPHTLIIGYDHHFGKERKGNYQLLEKFGKQLGFIVKEINEQLLEESAISSTRVRKALLHGDITTTKALLGYNYFFEGIVIKGDQLGRTIGYPTANLQMIDESKLVMGDGVYAVTITNNMSQLKNLQGMMYIGSRPVVNGKRRVIEVNIFNFNEDIYGEKIRVYVKNFVRGDMNFNGLNALKIQLAKDQIACEKLLATADE